jgi:hypothetical protein
MLVRAVTKAWQESLDGPPSIGRVYRPKAEERTISSASVGWCRSGTAKFADHAANDDVDPDGRRENLNLWAHEDMVSADPRIIPKRRVVVSQTAPSDSLWTSYEFWMGIVAGAGAVLLIKTVIAIQAPYGIYWY